MLNPRLLFTLVFRKMLYDNSRKMAILFLLPPPSAPGKNAKKKNAPQSIVFLVKIDVFRLIFQS